MGGRGGAPVGALVGEHCDVLINEHTIFDIADFSRDDPEIR